MDIINYQVRSTCIIMFYCSRIVQKNKLVIEKGGSIMVRSSRGTECDLKGKRQVLPPPLDEHTSFSNVFFFFNK